MGTYPCHEIREGRGTFEGAQQWEYYMPNEVAAIAHHIREKSIGGHTFGRIVRWIAKSIAFGKDTDMWGIDGYWAAPTETLVERKGDCKDHAFLQASMLQALGYEAYFIAGILLDEQGNFLWGHAWVEALAENGIWYYLENGKVGEVVTLHSRAPRLYVMYHVGHDACYNDRPGTPEPWTETPRMKTSLSIDSYREGATLKPMDPFPFYGYAKYHDGTGWKNLNNGVISIYDKGPGELPLHVMDLVTTDTGYYGGEYRTDVPGKHIIQAVHHGTGEPPVTEMAVYTPPYEEVIHLLEY